MAHDINRMIYVGEMPWHGLGVRLPARASYEEIVQAAGFYEAVEKDVNIPPFRTPIPDRKALVRGDTGEYLAVVGKGYEVVQFGDVARTLVEAAGDVKAVFTTAGTLGPVGIRGWLLGELPNPITVRGDPSPIRKYVLGTTGHDGLTAVVIKNVATRVVCANTLGVALGERGGATWRIQHTANAKARLDEAGKAFARLARSYERLGELANVLAVTPFTGVQM
jgi:phage/plasmid-like protein (TIGR03299 family)